MMLSKMIQYFAISFDTLLTIASIFTAIWIYHKQSVKQEKNALREEIIKRTEQMHRLAMDSLTTPPTARTCAEYDSHKTIAEICINRLKNYETNKNTRYYEELKTFYDSWIGKAETRTPIRSLQDKYDCSMVKTPTGPMNDEILQIIHSNYSKFINSLNHY